VTPADAAPSATSTLDEAMRHAISRHRMGELDVAEQIYVEVLRVQPRRPDALNFMGMLRFQRGDADGAHGLLKRASMIAPKEAPIWNNLGNVLMGMDRLPEAEKAFRRSLALADSAEAHTNIARIQHRREQWARGEASCRRAIALTAQCGEAWHTLSLILLAVDRPEEAFDAAVQAELLLPPQTRRRESYGRALSAAGEHERALAFYRDWLDKEPGNAYAQHHLAASLGETSERASEAYVEQVFDRFAANFDAQLATLKYRAPELVAEAMRIALPAPAAQFDIADLGCGTGLCGPLIKPWARRLTGCDLSAGMLARAAPRQVYDALLKADLVQFLADSPGAFDVLVSADTLIYFGELCPVFAAAHAALRPDGTLVCTVEALPDDSPVDYRLNESGRYAQTQASVRANLAAAGFDAPVIIPASPRYESGKAVAGWLVTVRRG
jgi:predicted TPR repeat methyltransferase